MALVDYLKRHLNDISNTVWSDATITRFANEAEDAFLREFPCVIDRISIAITANVHTYTLSDYVIDIKKITWLGKRLDPLTHRRLREAQIGLSSTGTPTDYIFDNLGALNIRFFPIPTVDIAASVTNLFGSEIGTTVIVEYYRTPDYSTYTIPVFIRQRLIKAYVMYRCFSTEGKGKNIKAAKYWNLKWLYLKETYGNLLDELINSPRRIVSGQGQAPNRIIPRPVLPYDKIGIGVNPGE